MIMTQLQASKSSDEFEPVTRREVDQTRELVRIMMSNVQSMENDIKRLEKDLDSVVLLSGNVGELRGIVDGLKDLYKPLFHAIMLVLGMTVLMFLFKGLGIF